jgi:hypothetical protein
MRVMSLVDSRPPARGLAAAFAALALVTGWPAAAELRVLALTGTPAPGTGRDFESFLIFPDLDDGGRVAFRARLTGAEPWRDSLWWATPDGVEIVARSGDPAPGVPGAVLEEIIDIRAAGAQRLAFSGTIAGGMIPETLDEGIWSNRTGPLAPVAREGTTPPGFAPGVVLRGGQAFQFALDGAGRLALNGFVDGAGIVAGNDQAIWAERAGALALVVREGEPAPGAGPGTAFGALGALDGDGEGRLAFGALLIAPAQDLGGVFAEGDAGLAPVAIGSAAAPGVPGASFAGFQNPCIDQHAVFAATLSGGGVTAADDAGLWSNAGGPLALVLRKGGPVPGLGPGFSLGTLIVLDCARGRSLLRVALVGATPQSDTALLVERAGGFVLRARGGAGAAAGTVGASFAPFTGVGGRALNRRGAAAFVSNLVGTLVDSSNDRGIWREEGGVLTLLVRKGDALEVAPGDTRTIADLSFSRAGYDDRGRVAFIASLDDGSQALVLAPEPRSAALAGALALALVAARRRARALCGALTLSGALCGAGDAAAQPMESDLLDTLATCAPGLAAGVVIGETPVGAVPLDVGYRFTIGPEGFWIAKQLTVCVSTATGMPGHEFSLRTDEAGAPGELLYAFTFSLPLTPTLVSDTATVRPAKLAPGASYWLVAERSFQPAIWWLPMPAAGTALQAQREGVGPWQTSQQPIPQLRLRALPEPAPGPLAACAALLAAAALARRGRRARAARPLHAQRCPGSAGRLGRWRQFGSGHAQEERSRPRREIMDPALHRESKAWPRRRPPPSP